MPVYVKGPDGKRNKILTSEEAREVSRLTSAVNDAIRREFLSTHPGSYLVQSMAMSADHIQILAPKYNMEEVAMKGLDFLRFGDGSYASELDTKGSEAMVKANPRARAWGKPQKTEQVRKKMRVYVGNRYRFTRYTGEGKPGTRKIVRKDGKVYYQRFSRMIVKPKYRIVDTVVVKKSRFKMKWVRWHFGYHRGYIMRCINEGIEKWRGGKEVTVMERGSSR